jgi:hypothetical protein
MYFIWSKTDYEKVFKTQVVYVNEVCEHVLCDNIFNGLFGGGGETG